MSNIKPSEEWEDIYVTSNGIVIPNWSVLGKTGNKHISQMEKEFGVPYKEWLQKAIQATREEIIEEVYTKLINLKPEKQDTEWQIGATDTLNQVRRFLDSLTDTNTKKK